VCGIAGIYASAGQEPTDSLLLQMAGELRHRGPDGTGLYLDRRLGMVGARLAIVDLEQGDQPLSNEDGRYWVVQNGELYNYIELREELSVLGHRFSTESDTEVLVHAYEEWGSDCLRRLNGDFAFAVWDRVEQELFLARDRFGARPLFLAEYGGDLVFASEAKALLRHPLARRELDPLGLVEAFTIWSILPDRSAFVGVRELPPAQYLRFGPAGAIEERRWWDLPFDAARSTADPGELEHELRGLLADATRIRLRADVPVAAYLSGGLDSSLIASLARRSSTSRLFSFGLGFADERFDESRYQDRFVAELGTELTRTTVDAADIAELMPRAIELAEKPMLRTAPAPLLRLSQAVHEAGLKVVLTGEGADELFAGYDIFRENAVRRFWARDPQSKLRPLLFTRLNEYLARDLRRAGAILAGFYGRGLSEVEDPLYSHRIRFANTARCVRLLSAEVQAKAAQEGDPLDRIRRLLPDEFGDFTPLGRAQYLEVLTFLNTYLLHAQGDRMMMGNSIEGRFPFLDYRVAEFAARLPDRLKLRGLEEKYLLRRAAAPLLPAEIAGRRKRPYRAPIAAVFTGPGAADYARELLEPGRLDETGLFDVEAVGQVVRKCGRLDRPASETDEMALVGTVTTMLLQDRLVARPVLAPAVAPAKVVVGDVQIAAERRGHRPVESLA